MSDYNLKSGCTLKYSWNWKTLKTLSSGDIYIKKTKKNKKKQKKRKKQKQTNWAGFFFKPGFFQPWGQQETPRPGYQLVEFTPHGHTANINNSTSSANFLTYRRAADLAPCNELVITELALIVTSRGEEPPHSFVRVDRNLNRSLVGSDVYLCFKGQWHEIFWEFFLTCIGGGAMNFGQNKVPPKIWFIICFIGFFLSF
jgi:hypothetical protein